METNNTQQQGTQSATQPNALVLLKSELPTLKALVRLNAKQGTDFEAVALQELEYLKMQCALKPDILDCAPTSVILSVKSAIKKNLSLDPAAGLIYCKTRSVNIGSKDSPKWIKVLETMETANGLISVARQCGRIIDIKRPTIKKDASGKVESVIVEYQLPNGRWEVCEFDESDFERWRRASDKENGRGKQDGGAPAYKYANPNYTNWKGGLDPEFARAKAIRHGLKKIGTNVNERFASSIFIEDAPKTVIIEPVADMNATTDDTTTEVTTVEHVVVQNEPQQKFTTGTSSEATEIPSL